MTGFNIDTSSLVREEKDLKGKLQEAQAELETCRERLENARGNVGMRETLVPFLSASKAKQIMVQEAEKKFAAAERQNKRTVKAIKELQERIRNTMDINLSENDPVYAKSNELRKLHQVIIDKVEKVSSLVKSLIGGMGKSRNMMSAVYDVKEHTISDAAIKELDRTIEIAFKLNQAIASFNESISRFSHIHREIRSFDRVNFPDLEVENYEPLISPLKDKKFVVEAHDKFDQYIAECEKFLKSRKPEVLDILNITGDVINKDVNRYFSKAWQKIVDEEDAEKDES